MMSSTAYTQPPANGLLSLDLGPVTQGERKVSKCEGMISMAWERGKREGERERESADQKRSDTKASTVVAVRCRSEALLLSPVRLLLALSRDFRK